MYSQTPGTALPPGLVGVLDKNFQESQDQTFFLDGGGFYRNRNQNFVTKVAPAPPPKYSNGTISDTLEAFDENGEIHSRIFTALKPVYITMRLLGILPVIQYGLVFTSAAKWIIYSFLVLCSIMGFLIYLRYFNITITRNAEGRFEEAVVDYLFTVYLLPIVVNLIAFYEARKQAEVLTQFVTFERIYTRTFRKRISLDMGTKPMIITSMLLMLGCGIMVVTHFSMADNVSYQVIPYCYVNVVTYIIGGAWYIYCDVIGTVATSIAEEFQVALRKTEHSERVADYRSLWMMLSKIIRNVGNAFGYQVTFLCLYLFFVITLTVYGLLSQIQEGMGYKDIGLAITGISAVVMLYFICDEAHYASSCVRTYFQKKILLVELSFLSEDAQQEINMFLRATEMNPTDMCLCGFFDVNRNLFKSLLATMVTYLVVLLQFQISIPAGDGELGNSTLPPSSFLNKTKLKI
ncbi:gustatory and odorant receptor 24-like [Euwallacea fornicatus]|uniref:gustatory and odorant receptor 24-like n=1 Tax=Euwallacea fornicatus TaxID=995702 RepID=UPI00338F2ABA